VTDLDIARLIIGESAAIRRVRALIARVAPTGIPVLIQGPTGSGKELVAQALHLASGRSGPFVAFNVCAIADSMFEDAVFGHVRGAFTGATSDARGYLAEAHRGTVFLDEISGLPLQAQVKLLRAIETRMFRPVGAREDQRSDFRLVAAANETLDRLVDEGRFRSDLGFRLSGVIIEVPPLRERVEDIPVLVRHFTERMAPRSHPVLFTVDAMDALRSHDWPGNVRELRHVIESAATLCGGDVLGREDVASVIRRRRAQPEVIEDSFSRRRLIEVLEQCGWDANEAARRLGVHRVTVYRRMRRLGISRPDGLRAADRRLA
jgi:sigma-54 dependent transcriptional regulator, flagellar regulatory protein